MYRWADCEWAGDMLPGYESREIDAALVARTAAPDDVFCYPLVDTWRDRIWRMLSDVITDDVRAAFVRRPPEYIVSDNLGWLDDLIFQATGRSVDMRELVADRLSREFRAFRAGHGTRTNDLGRFYTAGLRRLAPEDIEDRARELFLNGQFQYATEARLQAAIEELGARDHNGGRGGKLYFCADEASLVTRRGGCGHYLVYGSEYLYCLGMRVPAAENLEKIVADAFKRETDQDENVARTLPFFTATLALAISVLGFISRDLPPILPPPNLSFGPVLFHVLYVGILYGSLLLAAAGILAALWFLAIAVRMREYRLPPSEVALVQWVEELRAFYQATGTAASQIDELVCEDLRQRMTAEFAAAAVHNRENNRIKMAARSNGFTTLTGVLAMAFVMVAIMFIGDRVRHPHGGGSFGNEARNERTQVPDKLGVAPTAQAAVPAKPGCPGGREVPVCADSRKGRLMSDEQKPAPTPAPAQQAPVKPEPPVHQILKKNDNGSYERR